MKIVRPGKIWTRDQSVAALLAVVAGFIGAIAFKQSTGLFVTFMTGNAQKAVLGFFHHSLSMSFGAFFLSLSFFLGVFTGSICNRRLWKNHPHGAAIITTLALGIAAIFAFFFKNNGAGFGDFWFWDLIFIAYATGSLNTSFTKNGQTVVPITYHTGTLVKLAQGVESHLSGGSLKDWAAHAIMYVSFSFGALLGGIIGLRCDERQMLVVATIFSGIAAYIAYRVPIEPIPPDSTSSQATQSNSSDS